MKTRTVLFLAISGLTLLAGLYLGIRASALAAPADPDAVAAAIRLYEAGNYAEAIQIFEGQIASNGGSSGLYYNLGNAYYQAGDLGRAILNYKRASELSPRDPDIKANLALARAEAEDLFAEGATNPLDTLAGLTGSWLTMNETALILLALWFIAGFLLLSNRLVQPGNLKTGLRYGALLAVLLVLLAGLSFGSRLVLDSIQQNGVVISPAVAISSSPDASGAADFTLHSGTEINLLERQGGWGRLELPGGAQEGWIPLDSIETFKTVEL